ncbi:MAG: leucine-rich repeat domain-containing protein, partial [Bacilli bacterium]|nr:leucine-rich repeat domain-containing protein [Bacilli bacterium]
DEVAKKGTLERYFLSQLSVKIPSKVEGVSITSIGSGCFYDSQIKSIEIPEGVEKIEESAFCNCKELETVALPTSLAFIGEYAFGDCKKLKRVSFGPNIKKISAHSFQGCSSLDCFSFDANASLQEIGEKAFAGCATTRILLPQVKEIKEGAVECDIVTYSSSETVSSWPSSIQKLCKIKNVSRIIVDNDGFSYVFLRGKEGANLYDYRGSLSGKEIRIPRCVEGSSVTSIVFDAWEKLRDASKIYVPASIKRIEQKRSNLDFNYSLKEIEFEEGSLLETIPDFFADKATHLKKINLSSCNQLKTIGSYAFRFCALENLELPCSLSSLGEGSFESGIKSPTREIVIPRGVESIPPRCFAGCSVSNFSLPESLTEIGDETFKDVKMDSIYIPRNVISVGDGALVGVKNITFGELAKNIRFGRFYKSLFAKAQFGKYE